MAFCTKCGASVADGAQFCGICGAQLTAQPAQPGQQTSPMRRVRAYQQEQPANYPQTQQQPQQQYGQQQQYGSYQQSQQQYGNYQQQPRQPYGGYQQADYGWDRDAVQQNSKPKHSGLLRFLSILFAIGLIIAAAGFGSDLYFNRMVNEDTKESSMNETEKQISIDAVKAIIRCDVKGLKDVVKRSVKQVYADQLSGNEAYLKQIEETIDQALANMDEEKIREAMKEDNEENREELGIRWILFELAARRDLLLIIGGGVAAAALILWIIMGGFSAGKTILPGLIIGIILAGGIFALCFLLETPDTMQTSALTTVMSSASYY